MESTPNQQGENRELLTAKEAAQIFIDAGLSVPTFRRRVQAGLIESIMPEDRQRGAFYPKDQVLAAIGEKEPKKAKKKKTASVRIASFMKATTKDMPEMASLLETFYKAKISVEKRAAWIQKNPDIAYILRTKDTNQLVGCSFVMPLSEEKIMQILESQVKPPTRPHEIPIYEQGKHYSLYIRAVGVLQSVSKEQRRQWAAALIKNLAQAIVQLGAKGIFIDRIYAQGDTRQGEKNLRSLGFTQIEIKAATNRRNYMLDISLSGSPFAIQYKNTLNAWRAQNEEE